MTSETLSRPANPELGPRKVPAPTTEPLSIGIVGLGWGHHIIKSLQKPEYRRMFQVTAVCDWQAEKAGDIARGIGARVATFEELLDDPNLKTIGLFSGPSGRADLIRRAIRAGKHVMTTKPFERDSGEAVAVLEEASSLKRIVHLNSPSPVLPPDLACMRAWQKKHTLGIPVSAQFSSWVRYHEKQDGRWYDDPESCPVAPIFRIGIYLIHDALELFGEPEEVYVQSSRLFTGRPTADNAQLGIRFKNGSLVNILASFCVADGTYHRNTAIVNFQNGTVYRNVGLESREGTGGKMFLVTSPKGTPICTEQAEFDHISGSYQWEEFYRAVREGILPAANYPAKVSLGLRVVEAMAMAEKCGQPVKVSLTGN